jgi:molybdenum cofactor cytidylyltransferase
MTDSSSRIVGILLAAGLGTRFDPSGKRSKLLQQLPDKLPVAAHAAAAFKEALPHVVAVVRPGADEAASLLRSCGCSITVCSDAQQGMGASLVHAIRSTQSAEAWIIGLADMPYVLSSTIRALAEALKTGAGIAVPVWQGRRGNPVAFSRAHLDGLLQLGGDEGARRLLRAYPVTEVPVNDPGILRDIDTPDDLAGCRIAT